MIKKLIVIIIVLITGIDSFAQFGLYASAAYINTNGSNTFYNNTAPGLGQDIGTTAFQGTNFGLFEQNSGTLKFTGAEIKTFKGASDNVCSGTLYFTVYLTGSRPASPVFTPIILGFYSNCFAPACGTFFGSYDLMAGGGCCSAGDQKWQSPGSGSPANIDLTTYIPGDYTLEVYYAYTGQDGGAGCGTTKYDNNNNNPTNYTASFTITIPVPVSFGNIYIQNKNYYNSIYWNTYSEAQTNIFKLQRSENGINFYDIAEIPAAGFSATVRSYSLPDNDPVNGINYYRIKMIESGGRYQNSPVVKTINKIQDNWHVLSDPANKSIGVFGIEKGDNISIFNALGAKIFKGKATENYLNIRTLDFPTGICFVKVTGNRHFGARQAFISH